MSVPLSHLRTATNKDGAAVLDSATGQITVLNPTGAAVWEGLQRGESPEHIASRFAVATGLSVNAVEEDVRVFIEHLRDNHLLTDKGA